MRNKLKEKYYRIGAGVSVGLAGLLSALTAHGQTDPFALETKITKVASTTGSYFDIMIDNFWPFAIGLVVILGVVGLAWWGIHKFFHRG